MEATELVGKGPFGGQIFPLDTMEDDLEEMFALPEVQSEWGKFKVIRHKTEELWVVEEGQEYRCLARIETGMRDIIDSNIRGLLRNTRLPYTKKIRPYFVVEPDGR